MGKFKFLIILILALFLVCGIVMVVDAPSSFDDSVSLIPTSDSSVDADSSNCESGTCLVDSNKTDDNSVKTVDKDSKDDKINYDSKYYVDDFIDGLYFCNDFEYAFKEAKAHNRNVMIIFDGAACIYCEYLKEGTLTDPSVQKEINENNILLITESSESPELFQQLDVYGTPTTVILDPDGKELGRIDGYEPPEEYLRDLKEINGH
ncbi:thioredoxin family protein [uncultured Methanobrevibacter sp.]|uniref:thioredoxin family protein n=1 Tax=uncultured Methanobrevibacter sp. TaxID=253161 RepID=UPI002636A8EF|nr:thioredoxin family protein [uncultured Methanobrevibacter sp.]